jgi:heterodisulfide reductase subunit A
MTKKIGAFICQCGGNISNVVDVDKVAKELEDEDIELAEVETYLCSEPSIERMKEVIEKKGLDRLVLACCTPKMHLKKFQRVLKEAGVNPALVDVINVREHCSWVHEKDPEGATLKAADLIRGGIERIEESVPLETKEIDVTPKVLVVGGGIAGIISSLRVAENGLDCYLVEKEPSIGGHMIQYPKVFPTLDCSQCILTPKLGDVRETENINLLTLSEVEDVTGYIGNLTASVLQKPRYIDSEKCTACGECTNICPVVVPSEFDQGLGKRKAAYRPFLQAVPQIFTIDETNCLYFKYGICRSCETICPAGAVDFAQKSVEKNLDVGAIILATGYDLYDPSALGRYLYGKHPNVITSLQMERMLDITGPTSSRVIRPNDGKSVKKVAFVLCAGSRNNEAGANRDEGVPYCSTVCCLYAQKQAQLLRKFDIDVWIHYIDIRSPGTKYEDFYHHTQELGVNFIKGKVSEIMPTPNNDGRLIVKAEDMLINRMIENEVDLVVLCPPILPSEGTEELAQRLKIPLNEYKFILESHPKLDPLATKKEGIFAAGMATGPKDIQTTVSEAEGAAMKAVNFVSAKKEIEPNKAYVIPELCTGCRECIEICPEDAITIIDEKAVIDDLACTGCGMCIPICPENSIDMQSYSEEQLLAQIRGTLKGSKADMKILVFIEKELVYTAADIAGVSRLTYPSSVRFIPLPSNARLKLSYILYAFANGADGVMFLEAPEEEGPVPEAHKAAEKLIEEYQEVLEDDYDLDSSRLWFSRIFVPDWRKLATVFDAFHQMIDDLGPLTEEERESLMKAWAKGAKVPQVQ